MKKLFAVLVTMIGLCIANAIRIENKRCRHLRKPRTYQKWSPAAGMAVGQPNDYGAIGGRP